MEQTGVIICNYNFYPTKYPEDDCHTDTIIRALCDFCGPIIFDISPSELLSFAKESIKVIRDYGIDEPRLETHTYYDDALTRFEIDSAIEMITDRIID